VQVSGWRRSLVLALACAVWCAAPALAAPPEAHGDEPASFERTPPRLAYVDGAVSYWRSGADDWAPARVNLALAQGDRLYAGDDSNLELQIGARAFLRAGDGAEIGLETQEPDFLQFRVASGTASLDLRSLPPGHTVELDTPNAAFTIEDTGYYRVDVDGDTTTLISRRGGHATLTPAHGRSLVVGASEEVVVEGEDGAKAASYAAPELDDWDRWNYRRTDSQLDSLSARYVAPDVYGASDLDQYGSWRTVADYGPIWIPRAVPVGWAPYGFGRWVWDPYYGWTWLDDAPWGWAPFHYGRWVFVTGHWAWAPGPIVVRTYYAPALVAFFGGGVSVAWTPLGWGEPCVPWWGPHGWYGQPHWLGWGGPRVVNKVVIDKKTVVHADSMREYANARQPGGYVAVDGRGFGRKPVEGIREKDVQPEAYKPVRGALPVTHGRESFAGSDEKAERPPPRALDRRVVATRHRGESPTSAVPSSAPAPLLVPAPQRGNGPKKSYERPPFGSEAGEERNAPKPPPRFERTPPKLETPEAQQPIAIEPARPARESRKYGVPAPQPTPVPAPSPGPFEHGGGKYEPHGVEAPHVELPGEPANRVYRGRANGNGGGERGGRERGAPTSSQPGTTTAPGQPPGLRDAPGLR